MEGFLFQASIYLAAAVIAVPLAARLGLGSVLGYLAAGIVIGPIFGFVGGHETEELQHFAEFGVVMMLFLIGLELEPRALWNMRDKLLGLGGLQILVTTLVVTLIALVLGQNWRIALTLMPIGWLPRHASPGRRQGELLSPLVWEKPFSLFISLRKLQDQHGAPVDR